jgi:two-component system, cell cycle response regulator
VKPLRVLQALLVVAVAAYAVQGAINEGGSTFWETWAYPGLILAAGALCLARAIAERRERVAWSLLGAGMVLWAAGEAWYSLFLADLDSPPLPSVSDALWLAFYPCCYTALVLLVHGRQERLRLSLWLDGVIGALAVASVGAALIFRAIVASGEGDTRLVGTDLAYLLGDFALIGLVVAVFALTGWRPGRTWGLLGAGLVLFALVDGFFMWEDATGRTIAGTAPAALWPAGALLVSFAAFARTTTPGAGGGGAADEEPSGVRLVAMPLTFAVTALALLVVHAFAPLNPLALGLAVATLAGVIVRLAVAFHENLELLASSRHEALTDALTGLGNRRRLMLDLERAAAEATNDDPRALMMFDLDGFKRYNDCFGHPAGDALLAKLGSNLTFAIGAHGTTYRLGGDEFCVLLHGGERLIDELRPEAKAALAEHGRGFEVGSSCGVALIPADESEPAEVLKLADHRLYDQKATAQRTSVSRQAGDALLQALQEREPDLRGHVDNVAELALAVGREMGLDSDELFQVARAADLHDVGKLAVPDAILNKPGPLDDVEWGCMRQHTIVGDRILSAAPALEPVAKLVRASHERYDGGGYPDRLAGDDIPLGARIVAVCDAFHAMTSDRPYRSAMPPQNALLELRRCSGLQFDPDVVRAFCRLVDPGEDRALDNVAFLRAAAEPA